MSGYDLRNRANFSGLSNLWEGTGAVSFGIRPQANPRRSSLARTVNALDPVDIGRLLVLVKQARPAFVVFEGVNLLEAIEAVRGALPQLPIVLDMHNVESQLQIAADRARLGWLLRPVLPWAMRKRNRKMTQADQCAVDLADMVWTCSEEDAALAERCFHPRQLDVIANPIPEWCAASVSIEASRPRDPVILFVGHLGYPPNRIAVKTLCQGIMPRLQRLIPAATLHICGRNPSRRVRRLAERHGHRLTANPPNLASHYAEAMATAIPLAQGGGTRIKVLEALAVGCPIVASAKAVEGLGLRPGQDYLAAESSEAFAIALKLLWDEPELRTTIVHNGRQLVYARYGEAARRGAMKRALMRLTASVSRLETCDGGT